MYSTLPPLFPAEIKDAMAAEIERLENEQVDNLDEIESSMIRFGYEVWPWHQAFEEMKAANLEKLGEHFLLPKLPVSLQRRYTLFKNYGGSLREIASGRPAQFFALDERSDLSIALIGMKRELETYTKRTIVATEHAHYFKRVSEFSHILEDIKKHLQALRELAADELDHPMLVDEINDRVRTFEYGLCHLGPEMHHETVRESIPFFRGRRQDLNRLRGIHIPARINFD